jgi:hypothetical protein
MEQEYLVLVRIGGAGDKEMWLPGSRIMLSGDRAMAHLAAGNVLAINDTVPPVPATDDVVVHEADASGALAATGTVTAAVSRATKAAKE